MKEYEYRQVRGFCRLCEKPPQQKAVVIPFRYSGKSAPIILCNDCISLLNEKVESEI